MSSVLGRLPGDHITKIGSMSTDSAGSQAFIIFRLPREINIDDRYQEFKVDDVKADRIIFTNAVNIQFTNPTSLLDNRVMFRVADNRKRAYAYTIIFCGIIMNNNSQNFKSFRIY